METRILPFNRIVFLLVSIFFVFALSAQNSKPSFAGTWNLNPEKSQNGEGPGRRAPSKIIITEIENNLIMERTISRQSGETVTNKEIFNLTGTETDNSTENRRKKSVASWSADNLDIIIKSTTSFERNGNTMEMKSTEVLRLSSDQKVLTIENTMSSQRGDFKTTTVYDRGQ